MDHANNVKPISTVGIPRNTLSIHNDLRGARFVTFSWSSELATWSRPFASGGAYFYLVVELRIPIPFAVSNVGPSSWFPMVFWMIPKFFTFASITSRITICIAGLQGQKLAFSIITSMGGDLDVEMTAQALLAFAALRDCLRVSQKRAMRRKAGQETEC